ncbi:hypothetical protein AB0C07_19935 [Actinoplanes missouriensis]|uniref:hypothetical protein n=1 Tax=Actinoplanes missouriensis TaxID=1866 RepID=UPI0033D3A342
MRLIDDELRAALRAEAVRHRPDRELMLDRITQTAMRNQFARHRAVPRLRITGAAVAVAAVLTGGGFAQWALAGDGAPPPGPPAPAVSASVVPPASQSPSRTPSPPPSGPAAPSSPPASPGTKDTSAGTTDASAGTTREKPRGSSPAGQAPATSASPSVTGATDPAVRGPLWSDGSIDASGAQGTGVVTIRTTERLTALDVTIRVARTPELVSRGGSEQVPGASVTSTVAEEADALVYRFQISSGDTLDPGTYVFYARYTHAEGGRDAGADGYAATAVTESGATVNVTGSFG